MDVFVRDVLGYHSALDLSLPLPSHVEFHSYQGVDVGGLWEVQRYRIQDSRLISHMHQCGSTPAMKLNCHYSAIKHQNSEIL